MNEVLIVGAGISGLSTAALLTKQGIPVRIFEKANSVGGRTTSMVFKNHILDNGFHIMPFYRTSAVYQILKEIGAVEQLQLSKVEKISFFREQKFHKYPKGILDIFGLSMVPFKSRIKLLQVLLPMADRKSTRLNSSHSQQSRMPSSA